MQINEVAYKWAGQLTRRTATRRIILHHAAAVTCTPQQVHQWHLANGWTGIGYHFFVRKDGTVYRGRPEDTVGAHAGNNNYDSLGVCFEGSFDRETMPDAQLRAGQELARLDDDLLRQQRDQTAAQLAGQKAQLLRLDGSPQAHIVM